MKKPNTLSSSLSEEPMAIFSLKNEWLAEPAWMRGCFDNFDHGVGDQQNPVKAGGVVLRPKSCGSQEWKSLAGCVRFCTQNVMAVFWETRKAGSFLLLIFSTQMDIGYLFLGGLFQVSVGFYGWKLFFSHPNLWWKT